MVTHRRPFAGVCRTMLKKNAQKTVFPFSRPVQLPLESYTRPRVDVPRARARALSRMRPHASTAKALNRGAFVVVLSPAKALNERPVSARQQAIVRELVSVPEFDDRARATARAASKTLNAGKIKTLMGVSDAIATLNAKRFKEFEDAERKPCALSFDGPAFKHLDAETLDADRAVYLSQHLRVLSGMYGILRAYDAIAPYRLEMGTRWAPKADAKDLYEFWGADIANSIADDVEEMARTTQTKPFVVNCASQEYWKSVKLESLTERGIDVYTMSFPGPAVYAKQARGAMVRHCADALVGSPQELKAFVGTDGAWSYDEAASSEFNFVFKRGSAPAKAKPEPPTKVKRAPQTMAKRAPPKKVKSEE